MSDIDAELLALAGDDSDEEGVPQSTQHPQAESGEDSEDGGRSRSRGKGEKGKARHAGAGDGSASDEEVAMDESEGEAPDELAREPSAKYPIEGRFTSTEERDRIMSLTEIEREQFLAERANELEKEHQERVLRALVQSHKRKASEPDLREPGKKKMTKHAEGLEKLRSSREERSAKKASQPSKLRRSITPEADAEGDSEDEFDDRRRDETPDEEPPVKKDFDRIRVGRSNFAAVCFYPNFEELITGCYVRVSVGPNPKKPGQPLYRMGRIEGIKEKVPYAFPNADGRMAITTQHVVASIGKAKRESPFIHCSMGEFEQSEIDYYLSTLRKEGATEPKKSRLVSKLQDIHRLINWKFTDEDLNAKLKKSSTLQHNFLERERERLESQKQEADSAGDSDKVERIESQIANLKGPLKLGYGTSLGATKPADMAKKPEMTQQQRLAELNRQNRKADQERIRKALIQEKRAAEERRRAVESSTLSQAHLSTNGDGDKKPLVKIVDGKPVHNLFHDKEDLELPYPEWVFNYVDYSNKYLGSRSLRHLTFDDRGRAISEYPREMCDDEIIARMDIPISCITAEYD